MKIKLDCHNHTSFSPDGKSDAEELILRAIDEGLEYLSITDHADIGYADPRFMALTNLDLYFDVIDGLKQKYKDKITVAVGLEVGYNPNRTDDIDSLIKSKPLDYVINSVHEVNGKDFYFQSNFDGLTKSQAYNNYLDVVLQSLDAPYRFDAAGHITYVTRNAPYDDTSLAVSDYFNKIESILSKIINKNIILEINTSIRGNDSIMPNREILRLYRSLGGELITFSSDSHILSDLGRKYSAAANAALNAGFKYFFFKSGGKLIAVAI